MSIAKRSATYGKGTAILDVDVDDPFGLADRLRSTFSSPEYKPPLLPRVAMELYALSRKPSATAQEIVKLLETDPVMASVVLRKSQSAFYGGASVRTLREAVVRLGFQAMGNLFLEAATSMRVFRAPGYDGPMDRLRAHCSATAHLASFVARRVRIEAEHVFLCGLLHDVGAAAAVIALAESARGKPLPPIDVLLPAVYEAHHDLGRALGSAWQLPSEVTDAIAKHHDRAFASTNKTGACVALAEALAAKIGHAAPGDPPAPLEHAAKLLDLAPHVIDQLIREAEDLAKKLA